MYRSLQRKSRKYHPVTSKKGEKQNTDRHKVYVHVYNTYVDVIFLCGCFIFLHCLSYQKSSTRRSDPNLPNMPDIGVYDEVNKLSGLDINGWWKRRLEKLICQRFRRIMRQIVSMWYFARRWISLWQTLGGERPTTSVSDFPFDSHQCGQLYLPQGLGKRQFWQGMELSVLLW